MDYSEYKTGELAYSKTCAAIDVYPTSWSIPNRFSENHKISVVEVSLGDGMSLDKAEMSDDVLDYFFPFDAAKVADFVLGSTSHTRRIAAQVGIDYVINISELKSEFESKVLPAQFSPPDVDKYYAGAGLRFRIDTGDIGIYEALFEYYRDRDLSQLIFFYENDYTTLLYQQYIPAVDKLLGPFRDVNQDVQVTPPDYDFIGEIAGFLTGDFDYWYKLSEEVFIQSEGGPDSDIVNDEIVAGFRYPAGKYFKIMGNGESEGPFDSAEFKFQLPDEWEIKDQVRLGTDGSFIQGNDESFPDEDKINNHDPTSQDVAVQALSIEYNQNKTQYTISITDDHIGKSWDASSCEKFIDLPSSKKLDPPEALDEIISDQIIPRVSVSEWSYLTGIDGSNNYFEAINWNELGECKPRLTENNCFHVSFGGGMGYGRASFPICETVWDGNRTASDYQLHMQSSNATIAKECMIEREVGLWTTRPTIEIQDYTWEACAPETLGGVGATPRESRFYINHTCWPTLQQWLDGCSSSGYTCNADDYPYGCWVCDPCNGVPPPIFRLLEDDLTTHVYNCLDFIDVRNPCIEGSTYSSYLGIWMEAHAGECFNVPNKYGSTQFTGPKFDNVYTFEEEIKADGATLSIYGGLSFFISRHTDDEGDFAPELAHPKVKNLGPDRYVSPMYRKIIPKTKGAGDDFEIRWELFGGTVKEIKVRKGDIVKIGTVIMIIETGSVTREVVSPVDGEVSKISVDVGDSVSRNQVLTGILEESELTFSKCKINIEEGKKHGTLAGDWEKQSGDPKEQDVNIYYRDLPEIDFNHTNLVGELSQLGYSKTKDDLDGPRAGMYVAIVPTKIEMQEAEGIKSSNLTPSQESRLNQAMDQVPLNFDDQFGAPARETGTYPTTYSDGPHWSVNGKTYPCRKRNLDPDISGYWKGESYCRNPCEEGQYVKDFYQATYGVLDEDYDIALGKVLNLIDEYKIFPNPRWPRGDGIHGNLGPFIGRPVASDYECSDDDTTTNAQQFVNCGRYHKDLMDFLMFGLDVIEKRRLGRNGQCVDNVLAPRNIVPIVNQQGGYASWTPTDEEWGVPFGRTKPLDAASIAAGDCAFDYIEMPMPEPIEDYLKEMDWGCSDILSSARLALLSGSDVWDKVNLGYSHRRGDGHTTEGIADAREKYYVFPAGCKTTSAAQDQGLGFLCGRQEADVNNDGVIDDRDEIDCNFVTGKVELTTPALRFKITKDIVSIKSYAFTIGDEGDAQEEEDKNA